MICLNFYVAIVLTPTHVPSVSSPSFVPILAPIHPAGTATNPTSYSVHRSTWNRKRLACHVRKTAAFYKYSDIKQCFLGYVAPKVKLYVRVRKSIIPVTNGDDPPSPLFGAPTDLKTVLTDDTCLNCRTGCRICT